MGLSSRRSTRSETINNIINKEKNSGVFKKNKEERFIELSFVVQKITRHNKNDSSISVFYGQTSFLFEFR